MIKAGDSVILYAGISKLKLIQVQPPKQENVFSNQVRHSDLVGKSFG
jgi:hypothetical protein